MPQKDPPQMPAHEAPLVGPIWRKVLWWLVGLALAGALSGAILVAVALAMAYPQLPDVSEMRDYKPKLSMRIFSADGKQIGEFGEIGRAHV